jgi:hypothetical protein
MSKSFELKKKDLLNHARAMAIYLAPTAIVLVTQLQEQSDPNNIVYALLFSAVLDLLRRYLTDYNLQTPKEEV